MFLLRFLFLHNSKKIILFSRQARGKDEQTERKKKTTAVAMLCEGNSIRSVERITGIHRNTIMRLGVRGGRVSERIERLKAAVERACDRTATHVESHPATETFRGKVVWEGVVESFDLDGHPKANRRYAFTLMEGEERTFKTVLGIPPADSPLNAVRVAIAAKARR